MGEENGMKVLWAPWRMGYILAENKADGCIFCPGTDRSTDQDRLILHVGPRTMVVMNRFPYNNGHLLVAPVRHVSSLERLNQDETLGLLLMVRKSIEILKQVLLLPAAERRKRDTPQLYRQIAQSLPPLVDCKAGCHS